MIYFFAQNWGTIIVLLLVVAVCIFAAVRMYADKKQGKSSCGGACGGCPNAGLCHAKKREEQK